MTKKVVFYTYFRTTNATIIYFIALLIPLCLNQYIYASYRFSKDRIDVIRPRYFNKKFRFEFGVALSPVVNQTFSYPIFGEGYAKFYFNEFIGIETSYGTAMELEKTDRQILKSKFNISTLNLKYSEFTNTGLVLTPIYGKYQLPDGKVIYFDTFTIINMGTVSIDYEYKECTEKDTPRSPIIATYPTISYGLGQKFYVSKRSSIHWNAKFTHFNSLLKDASCNSNSNDTTTNPIMNINIALGYSIFL